MSNFVLTVFPLLTSKSTLNNFNTISGIHPGKAAKIIQVGHNMTEVKVTTTFMDYDIMT